MESKSPERIVVLVDMDCFYVQVEQKLCPEFLNKPCAVVQYNTWKGGGIIAVNYEARAKGVKRGFRGDDAKNVCPDIHLFRVPEVRGKADLTRYRDAGASVLNVLCEFCDCVERASIDEAYLDLTSVISSRMQNSKPVDTSQIPNTLIAGWEDPSDERAALSKWLQVIYKENPLYKDRMLALAAVVVEEMRAAVFSKTGFKCSAGIAHNKMLAKLSCGLHKPNKQTVLPESSVHLLYETIPINKVRNLGGKFGVQVSEKFDAKTMSDLLKISKSDFLKNFGEKSGSWLYQISRGIENEPVTPRQLAKSIGCGKNFPGKSSLDSREKVLHWIKQLSTELEERLLKDQESNRRIARLLTLNIRTSTAAGFCVVSKSCPIHVYSAEKIAQDSYNALQKFNSASPSANSWSPVIVSLAMAASKFEDQIYNNTCDIQSYFQCSTDSKDACAVNSSDKGMALNLLDKDVDVSSKVGKVDNKQCEPIVKKNDNLVPPKKNILKKQVRATPDYFKVKDEKCLSSKNENLTVESSLFTTYPKHSNESLDLSNCSVINSKTKNIFGNVSVNLTTESFIETKGFFAMKLEEHKRLSNGFKTNENSCMTSERPNIESFLMKNASQETEHSDSDAPQLSLSSNICKLSNGNTTETFMESQTKDNSNLSRSSTNSDPSELDLELLKICPECQKKIPIWEESEHNDFHLALNLSEQFQNEANSIQKVRKTENFGLKDSTGSIKSSKKRGNASKACAKAKKLVQSNTLDSFVKIT